MRLRGHYLAFATLAFAPHRMVAPLRAGSVHGRAVRHHRGEAPRALRSPDRGALHAALVWAARRGRLTAFDEPRRSRVGRALQAIATDEPAAAAAGIPVASYKLRLFVFAAALAGLGGGLFTFSLQFSRPEEFPIVLSMLFVVMVSIGGLGSVYGAVAGAVTILYLEHKLRELGAQPRPVRVGSPSAGDPSVLSLGVFGLLLIDDHALLPARPAPWPYWRRHSPVSGTSLAGRRQSG